jgi:Xaa-Pro aminopeptidase
LLRHHPHLGQGRRRRGQRLRAIGRVARAAGAAPLRRGPHGLPYEELHDASHHYVAEALRQAGIGKLSVEELVDSGITRAFYPNGLGHSLGLVCHDVGCGLTLPAPRNPWLRNTSTISERQVFTIEPGIYFIEGLLAPLRNGKHAHRIRLAGCLGSTTAPAR